MSVALEDRLSATMAGPGKRGKPQKWDLRARALPPRVGLTMRGYGQFCPVAVACEVFAERWAPLVARFDFRGLPARRRGIRTMWLVLKRPEIDLCMKDPGVEPDLVVSADLKVRAQVWLGDISFSQALRSRGVAVAGLRKWVQAFPGWLLQSGFAGVELPPRALAI